MKSTQVLDLPRHVGQPVTVSGWLYNRRSKGKIQFLQVRDGSGIVQAVLGRDDVPEDVFLRCESLPYETSLSVNGTVRADTRAPGGVELCVTGVTVHQAPTQEYPISKQAHGPDFLLSNRHLWLRSRKPHAILRVRDAVITAIRAFFAERGFLCLDAPIFTPSACEGTTNLFEVQYFEEKCYLTQSGQLYMEAGAMAFGRVYCFGPTFRAERSKTRRHLTEFWMVEPEVAFADLADIMDLAEAFLVHIVRHVLEHRRPELETLERDISKLERVVPPFPRLSYTEAAALLRQKGLAFEEGNDFGAPDETALSEHFDRPVLVHRYPAGVKAFYMKRDPADERFALCVDVLAPEGVGEIIGGGQREDDLDVLEKRIEAHGLPREPLEWFLDLRRYGTVPHAGFGLGLERTVAWLCGTEHVRECIPFPRMLYRIYP
ncbi:MAG TPA: asparagine--tRNA ligase [Planctomycetota bacterium]|nr:asparagine--tRNA ligase [Planctomycetota bacterium]